MNFRFEPTHPYVDALAHCHVPCFRMNGSDLSLSTLFQVGITVRMSMAIVGCESYQYLMFAS
jgi:hypothetical protein